MTGRELPPTSPFAGDDGGADSAVVAALDGFRAGTAGPEAVVGSLAGTRVLVPVLAEEEESGQVGVHGAEHRVDRRASTGIVALRARDGRTSLPVFSSVATMAAWRADARPVPTDIARAALSAVEEGWELLVLDPGGPVTVLLPRPAVWALARQEVWRPAVAGAGEDRTVDHDIGVAVHAAVQRSLSGVGVTTAEDGDGVPAGGGGDRAEGASGVEAERTAGRARRSWFGRRDQGRRAGSDKARTSPVLAVKVLPGDRSELVVELTLVPGLDRAVVDILIQRVGAALAADELVTRRVDSVELRLR